MFSSLPPFPVPLPRDRSPFPPLPGIPGRGRGTRSSACSRASISSTRRTPTTTRFRRPRRPRPSFWTKRSYIPLQRPASEVARKSSGGAVPNGDPRRWEERWGSQTGFMARWSRCFLPMGDGMRRACRSTAPCGAREPSFPISGGWTSREAAGNFSSITGRCCGRSPGRFGESIPLIPSPDGTRCLPGWPTSFPGPSPDFSKERWRERAKSCGGGRPKSSEAFSSLISSTGTPSAGFTTSPIGTSPPTRSTGSGRGTRVCGTRKWIRPIPLRTTSISGGCTPGSRIATATCFGIGGKRSSRRRSTRGRATGHAPTGKPTICRESGCGNRRRPRVEEAPPACYVGPLFGGL